MHNKNYNLINNESVLSARQYPTGWEGSGHSSYTRPKSLIDYKRGFISHDELLGRLRYQSGNTYENRPTKSITIERILDLDEHQL